MLLFLAACATGPTSTEDTRHTGETGDTGDTGKTPVVPVDEAVGDPDISYMNPEFTPDGRFMVWFEPSPTGPESDGRLFGTVWHCAVDLETGELDPPDGRGFAAFPASLYTRANTGADVDGPYYVGQRSSASPGPDDDRLVVVRPTSPTSGEVTLLSASQARPRRRSIFPTALTDRPLGEQAVWWLENDVGYSPGEANVVSLRYVRLDDPSIEGVVTEQETTGPLWSPMDLTYARLVGGTSWLTLGVPTRAGVEVAMFDLDDPGAGLVQVTSDGVFKLDPYPYVSDGGVDFLAGVGDSEDSYRYRSDGPGEPFTHVETVRTLPFPDSQIADGDRCQAQSHQTFTHSGQTWTAFQISDCGQDGSFLTRRGEIWLSSVDVDPPVVMRLSSDGPEANNEPEPLVGEDRAWVFYTRYPAGASPQQVTYELRRVTLPAVIR
ncbi:MAG: hypothetical protein KC621_23715 [Myxococcales bacterium]|nr:hypothetical protein [Myxococcales bacterium]